MIYRLNIPEDYIIQLLDSFISLFDYRHGKF